MKKKTRKPTTREALHNPSKRSRPTAAKQKEREKTRALLWALFASAALASDAEMATKGSAASADEMLVEWEKRWGHTVP